MYGAFQISAFQNNAFQILTTAVAPPSTELLGGGGKSKHSYIPPYAKYKEEEYLAKKRLEAREAKLAIIDKNIERIEQERLEKLAEEKEKRITKKAAKKLAALGVMLQEEISRLRMERAWLIRRINNERAVMTMVYRRKRFKLPTFS